MKLDRNINEDGKGKYALVRLRGELSDNDLAALKHLYHGGRLDYGGVGDEDEFFVIKLKDQFAQAGLHAYADAAVGHDDEWAAEVRALAVRSGPAHAACKRPD